MIESPFRAEFADGVLYIAGTVDEYALVAFRNAVRTHSNEHTEDLMVELSEVEYLPSVAISVMAKAASAGLRHGVRLQMVARAGSIAQRVLAINGLPHLTAVPGQDLPDLEPPA